MRPLAVMPAKQAGCGTEQTTQFARRACLLSVATLFGAEHGVQYPLKLFRHLGLDEFENGLSRLMGLLLAHSKSVLQELGNFVHGDSPKLSLLVGVCGSLGDCNPCLKVGSSSAR